MTTAEIIMEMVDSYGQAMREYTKRPTYENQKPVTDAWEAIKLQVNGLHDEVSPVYMTVRRALADHEAEKAQAIVEASNPPKNLTLEEIACVVLSEAEHRMAAPIPPKSSQHEYLLNGTWHATGYGFAMMAQMWAAREGKPWQADIERHVEDRADSVAYRRKTDQLTTKRLGVIIEAKG